MSKLPLFPLTDKTRKNDFNLAQALNRADLEMLGIKERNRQTGAVSDEDRQTLRKNLIRFAGYFRKPITTSAREGLLGYVEEVKTLLDEYNSN